MAYLQREKKLRQLVVELCGPSKHKQYIWLIEHLEEYIERWLGFERMALSVDMEFLVKNESFLIILAATNLLHEIAVHDASYKDSLSDIDTLKGVIDLICKHRRRTDVHMLPDTFYKIRKERGQTFG